jgi:hypothetical protein
MTYCVVNFIHKLHGQLTFSWVRNQQYNEAMQMIYKLVTGIMYLRSKFTFNSVYSEMLTR